MHTNIETAQIGREVELKLVVAPADRARMTQVVSGAGNTAKTATLTSVYFDTPGHRLRQAGTTLRVRHDGNRRIQTVKAEGSSTGLFDRPEWEFEIFSDTPDLVDDRSPLPDLIGKTRLDRVAPVFRSVISRTKTLVQSAEAAIELVIDHGEIANDSGAVAVCELELELRQGPTASLFALARTLDDTAPVRLGTLSKAERGYLLDAPDPLGSFKAEPVLLDTAMTAAAAFRAIAWCCLRHYRRNEDVLLMTDSAGALHQARVALRRLRSAFSLFKSVIDDQHGDRLRGELRWLAATLGNARNIDVLIERAVQNALRNRLESERTKANAAVGEALASPRVRRLMLDLAEWLTLGAETPVSPDDPMAIDFAVGRLQRLRKRLRLDGAGFENLADEDRHEVRIEAKKLRYATEFFTALFPGKKASKRQKQFRTALEAFQEVLGDLNDQVTGQSIIKRLGLETAPAAWQPAADRALLIGKAVEARAMLLDAKRFW